MGDDGEGQLRKAEPADNISEAVPEELPTTKLKEYLQNTPNGKRILKYYNKNVASSLPLPRKLKNMLVRDVIQREKVHALKVITADQVLDAFIIKKERFELLAREISTIFKFENPSVYYTPSIRKGKQVLLATGKLWNHYNYVKLTLRDGELLKETARTRLNDLNAEELQPLNDTDDIDWLKVHVEPWNIIVSKWTSSHADRRAQLVGSGLSVYDYIQQFPALQIQAAKNLFLNFAEDEDFVVLYLLCHIIKPKRNNKRKQDAAPRRLSLIERRETFILRVEAANDVRPKLLELKEHYMQNQETFQPVIVAVGEVSRVAKYYVVVDEKFYEVDTVLRAIKLALQIFFSLDCKYPQNSLSIWIFLQRILYDIELPFETVSLEVKELVHHIRRLLSQELAS